MSHSLIMPKQTGRKDVFYASMELFYKAYKNNYEWVANEDYKREIQILVPSLSKGAGDNAYLVKQSELTRYFGLAYYDYKGRKTKITKRGIAFYEAYLQNDYELQVELIMSSIFDDSFGRNNTAILSSDSDIDAPKLFIKTIYDLGVMTRKDLAYLLYLTHDKKICYIDALNEFRTAAESREITIPNEVSNKYSDVKFTVLLVGLGICIEENGKYFLSLAVAKKYADSIKRMSIYNKEPDVILTLNEANDELYGLETEENFEEVRKKVISSVVYDITSEKFYKQNNRNPEPYNTKAGISYKTNPRIAKTALHMMEFKCEHSADEHTTFVCKSGYQYMEAHHLVPMHAQKDFTENLDRVENIVSICPNCHSAIHLGEDTVRYEYLKKLYDIRKKSLLKAGINIAFEELFTKYYK